MAVDPAYRRRGLAVELKQRQRDVVPRARHHAHALDVRPAAARQRAPQPAGRSAPSGSATTSTTTARSVASTVRCRPTGSRCCGTSTTSSPTSAGSHGGGRRGRRRAARRRGRDRRVGAGWHMRRASLCATRSTPHLDRRLARHRHRPLRTAATCLGRAVATRVRLSPPPTDGAGPNPGLRGRSWRGRGRPCSTLASEPVAVRAAEVVQVRPVPALARAGGRHPVVRRAAAARPPSSTTGRGRTAARCDRASPRCAHGAACCGSGRP